MDAAASPPPLPPAHAVPGRSALAAFLPLEAWVAARRGGAKEAAEQEVVEARAKARRLREEAESNLEQLVLEAEAQAARAAEDRATDHVSAARLALTRAVERAEQGMDALVHEALERLSGR